MIFYTSEKVWVELSKSIRKNSIRDKADVEKLAREWAEIYPPKIPEIVIVRNEKIIDITCILSATCPQMTKYEDIKIGQYPEDIYETSSYTLLELMILQFTKFKNWISQAFL